MDRLKKNSSLRYFAGLVLLMVPVFLMIIAGPAFARYRSGESEYVGFEVREPWQICFVKVEETSFSAITDSEEFVWTKSEDGKMSLDISVANGSSKSNVSQNDQKVAVRLVTGLGLSVEDGKTGITLTYKGKVFNAKAEKIAEGSEFYKAQGEGWLITFVDQNGEEFSGLLEGKRFNYFDVTITVDESAFAEEIQITPVAKVIR